MKKTLFKDLMVGQEFDWVGPGLTPSFTQPCQKISTRKYRTTGGGPIREHAVGTTSAQVFNVKPIDNDPLGRNPTRVQLTLIDNGDKPIDDVMREHSDRFGIGYEVLSSGHGSWTYAITGTTDVVERFMEYYGYEPDDE